MNRKLLYALASLSLATLVLVFSVVGIAVYSESRDPVEKISAEIHASYLNEIISNYRNDLVSGNYRFFRYQISSLMARKVFSDYAILQNGKVVDSSETYAQHFSNAGFLKISVPVWFDEEKTEPWGSVELLVEANSNHRINHLISSGLKEFLLFSLGTFLLLVALYLGLWNWVYLSLSRGMESVFVGSETKGLGHALWRPLTEKLLRLKISHDQLLLERQESQKQALLVTLTRQVAHDIRSPLAALRFVTQDLSEVDGEKRLILRNAVDRINDIANDLLRQGTEVALESQVTMMSPLAELVVSEKRLQYQNLKGLDLSFDLKGSYGLFSRVRGKEIQRALSNLIDNSVEALPEGAGRVSVRLLAQGEEVLLKVSDDGKGISADIQPKLGQRGASFGKSEGSGLGLHQAKSAAEESGGRLEIKSALGQGAEITLYLPRAEAPGWFAPIIPAATAVATLDDDRAIHDLWHSRLPANSILASHSTSTDFERWYRAKMPSAPVLYLIDYELHGSPESGLELIERLNLAGASILVTSRFMEAEVQNRCAKIGLKMIPKNLAGIVPLA